MRVPGGAAWPARAADAATTVAKVEDSLRLLIDFVAATFVDATSGELKSADDAESDAAAAAGNEYKQALHAAFQKFELTLAQYNTFDNVLPGVFMAISYDKKVRETK